MAAPNAPAPIPGRSFRAEPYDYAEARSLAAALDLAEPIAVMLVRRGYRTVEQASDFLEARDDHDPFAFAGMAEVRERMLAVAGRGGRITVHGDYDVDGVCSTAILVAALRELGADCDWLIPDRQADGYGLTAAGVEQLSARGTELIVTADCGIASAAEVAAAQEAGIEVIVTDHHEPPTGGELPDCPILHPVVSGYPFSALCATAVAQKLAIALRGGEAERDLDLVALATVADLVPLVGENRRLVRAGLSVLRRAPRPGLRALMAVARVDAETVDEGALGFRLAPRINAVGRLYRADAGVELMLADESERAAEIAAELDRANSERRAVEREVANAAEAARRALPPEQAEGPALVLAGEGWHPGVLGIAASRLAERHWRPAVLLSIGDGRARGSARGIPGFDLIAALDACSEHLLRHGGHRAAAGLELRAEDLPAFRRAFAEQAAEQLGDEPAVRTESVDALVGVGRDGIGMELAEQLERLAPFGKGNPGPRLVVPSARLGEIRPLGDQGRHSRFRLSSGAGSASGVAFGMSAELEALGEEDAIDAGVRLELDRWNGAVSPRVVLRDLYPLADPEAADEATEPGGCGNEACPPPGAEWWARFAAAFDAFEHEWPPAPRVAGPGTERREVVDRRGGAAVAALAELVSSGDSVLALCADAARRRALAASAADPRRFGGGKARLACGRCGESALDAALGSGDGTAAAGVVPAGLTLADWGVLARRPSAPRRFVHVVLIDPPPFARLEALARAGDPGPAGATERARGFLHLAWGEAERELAERCAASEWELRGEITSLWRLLSASGGLVGEELRRALAGAGRYGRPPEVAARCARVLVELGLCEWSGDAGDPALRVLSSEQTQLERSTAFAAAATRHEEAKRYLRGSRQS